MSEANKKQIGGEHYNTDGEQHWDRMYRMFGPGYFIGCITKYTERYQKKNGLEDLEKAKHFIEKLIELEKESPSMVTVSILMTNGQEQELGMPQPDFWEWINNLTDDELNGAIRDRAVKRERDAMNEYARNLNGDQDDAPMTPVLDDDAPPLEYGDDTEFALPPGEPPVPNGMAHPESDQCPGCGVVAIAGMVLHHEQCPRIADLLRTGGLERGVRPVPQPGPAGAGGKAGT